MLNVRNATATIIPKISTAQKKLNKPTEILSNLSTVIIWSDGIVPPKIKQNKLLEQVSFKPRLDARRVNGVGQ